MAVGVVAHDSIAQPYHILHAVILAQILLNLALVQLRIAVRVEETRSGGKQVANPVDVDAATLHDDIGIEKLQLRIDRVYQARDLVVQLSWILATPSVIAPVDHSSTFSALVDEESRTVVTAPSVVGLELMEEYILHVGTDTPQYCRHLVGHLLVKD